MVPRLSFINKLRELNYTYKTKAKRTSLWRKIGGSHRIALPLSEMLTDEYVMSTLRQAGCQEDEIRTFLTSAKC
jgi:hypothetical protein